MGYDEQSECFVNVSGDYEYMGTGYYASELFETDGKPVHPTTQESVDAYVVPVCLEKAKLAGIPVPEFHLTNGYFEPPVIVDTVNPFMQRSSVVRSTSAQPRVAASLTRNQTYAICCQVLPDGAKVTTFRAIMGWSPSPRYRELAAKVWELMRIPLASVRTIVPKDGDPMLSAIGPLPYKNLSPQERHRLDGRLTWHA
jgi:hypothetical protein